MQFVSFDYFGKHDPVERAVAVQTDNQVNGLNTHE